MKGSDQGAALVENAYNQIKDLIVTCELPPGHRLNEKPLIERLGYGRTPIREALVRLTQDGLIEALPRVGYVVRPLSEKSVRDIMTTWGGVGPMIIATAMKKITPEKRQELLSLGEELKITSKGNPTQAAVLSGRLLGQIVQVADNESLLHIYEHLSAKIERVSHLLLRIPHGAQWMNSVESLCAILREPDPKKSAKITKDRIAKSTKEIMAFIRLHRDVLG